MKKLFIDTNIVIDLLAKREPFYAQAATLFSMADRGKIKLFVSALSFANTNYILLREMKAETARLILRKLKLLVEVTDLNEKILELALNDSDFKDFEDAIQYYSSIENDIDVIITRNLKDFKRSKIPVLTADQCLIQL